MATKQIQCVDCTKPYHPVFHEEGTTCPTTGRIVGTLRRAAQKTTQATDEITGDVAWDDPRADEMTNGHELADREPEPADPAVAADALGAILLQSVLPQVRREAARVVRQEVDMPSVMDQAEKVAVQAAMKYAAELTPHRVEIYTPLGEVKDLGVQHERFPILLRWLAQRRNVALRGPAGTGKTMAGGFAAQALGLKLYTKSVGPTTAEYDINGVRNVFNGEWIPAFLEEPFTDGGLVLWDEFDNGSADALLAINTALDNGYTYFGTRRVEKHPDCVFLASLNTIGQGRDAMYVGRSQLDAATLDRFNFITWGYDRGIERNMVNGYKAATTPEQAATIEEYYRWLIRLRTIVEKQNLRVVVSTRALRDGAIMLAADQDTTLEEVQHIRFFNKMGTQDLERVQKELA